MVYSKLSDKIESLNNQITVLTTEVISLKKLNSALESKVNVSEQKSKMCHSKLFGLKEKRGENLNEAVSKVFEERNIMIQVVMSQMSYHHLGAFLSGSNKPRGVMINFTTDSLRIKAFMDENQLKDSKMVLVEDLTKLRYNLMIKAKGKFGKENVWSQGGNIFDKIGGNKHSLKHEEDL
ncbi:hypothetical protein JTB14_012651 [Gonioctena quinquepunctata]|nr:hypothetical protein JTB14_012651 [Gonioctena quinquepunctata]